MPVELARYAAGIYITRWTGDIRLDDLFESQAEGQALIQTHQDKYYVLVIDSSNGRLIDMDFTGLRRLYRSEQNNLGLVLVGLNQAATFFSKTVTQILNLRVAYTDSIDKSVQIAQTWLDQKEKE